MHGLNLKLAVKSHYNLNHKCISTRYIPYFITDHGKSLQIQYKLQRSFGLLSIPRSVFSSSSLFFLPKASNIAELNVCAVTRELIQRRLYMQLMIHVRTYVSHLLNEAVCVR
ncbi:hypothetical protein I3842_05G213300 [Carya illinoinensis]|uniref:Uncharacterized protein n=1 Tax=Carya illinoinensis TaxID=32201 RepID=A0A922F7I6_CARIL|nr:hypothetical protein I3842_05G213300 [Carya illinoinensis]